MKPSDMAQVSGVFLAVKCAVCENIYDASSEDFVSFWGSVTRGMDTSLVAHEPPRRPAKKAITAVCRTPECIGKVVRSMLGCAPGDPGAPDAQWAHVLSLWTADAGLLLTNPGQMEIPISAKERVARKRKTAAA